PIAAAVTHTQPTVLPKFACGAEALRRMDVSTEPASTNRPHARGGLHDFDLRQSLRRPQHQHSGFGLRGHALVQQVVELIDGAAHRQRPNWRLYRLYDSDRETTLTAHDHSLHSQTGLELRLQTRLLAGHLIVVLHQHLEITARLRGWIMHFLEAIEPQ